MFKKSLYCLLLCFSLLTIASLCTTQSIAAVIVAGDPYPVGGIGYRWTITGMTSNDTSGELVSHVGSLSFEDPINFTNQDGYFGWTHTSNWIQLELTEAAVLNISLERRSGVPNGAGTAGGNLFPAFAIWRGIDNDDGDDHVYNNSGNFAWAEDLSYIGNENNTGKVGLVSKSFVLTAGDYSIVLAGNPPTGTSASRQGYTAILTTTAVPEPASVFVVISATVAMIARQQRKQRKSPLLKEQIN